MRLLALVSGGKDSILSILMSHHYGHEVVGLLNVRPQKQFADDNDNQNGGDVDSHCFQTVGYQLLDGLAECMKLPLFRASIGPNQSINQALTYCEESSSSSSSTTTAADKLDDEVEVLFNLVKSTCEKFAQEGKPIGGLCSGAILSNYQRLRVERICQRLKLSSFSFLWQRPALNVLRLVEHFQLNALLIKIASYGLKPTFLGKSLIQMTPTLTKLHREGMCHAAGEGGEFESVVLDCPQLFAKSGKTMMIKDGSSKVVGADVKCGSGEGTLVFDVDVVDREHQNDQNVLSSDDKDYFDVFGFDGYVDVETSKKILSELQQKVGTIDKFKTLLTKQRQEQKEHQEKIASQDCVFNFSLYKTNDESEEIPVGEQAKRILVSNLQNQDINNERSKSNILYTFVQGSEFKYFADVNASYLEVFSKTVPPPSRAFVGCGEDAKLKISVISMKSDVDDKTENNNKNKIISRSTLHVQSISNWAAACIGPYAQSQTLTCSCEKCQETQQNCCFKITLTSGTIGLEPPTMVLAGGKDSRHPVDDDESETSSSCRIRLFQECVMALANVHAILQKSGSQNNEQGLANITHGTIFFANKRISSLDEAECLSIFNEAWKLFSKRIFEDTNLAKETQEKIRDGDYLSESDDDDEHQNSTKTKKEKVFDAELQQEVVKISSSLIATTEDSFIFNLRVVLVETLPRDAAVEFIVGVASGDDIDQKQCESNLATVAISKFFAATQF